MTRVAAQPALVPTRVLTSLEAAEILGLSRATVLRWVERGHLHPIRFDKHTGALFDPDEVERVRRAGRPPHAGRKHRPCQCADCVARERVSA